MTRFTPSPIIIIIIVVVVVTSAITITIIAGTSWFLSNNKLTHEATNQSINRFNIALIKPTFTAAAYHHSFYRFYFIYASIPHARKNITTDLNLLSSKVTNQTSKSSSLSTFVYLPQHLKKLLPQGRISVLTAADVDYGSIFFENGTNKYHLIILRHQEYVSQREYNNLKHFVADGGTLVLLDGNVFYAEVNYDRNSQTITLVKGHGWAFNGKSAWRSVGERWTNETSQWAGSNYLCYSCNITLAGNTFQYRHHEEQHVTNPNVQIITNYNASITKKFSKVPTNLLVAAYTLKYQKGRVLALGIYSDDLITNKKFDKYLDDLLSQAIKRQQE
jgi:hypothetical protein